MLIFILVIRRQSASCFRGNRLLCTWWRKACPFETSHAVFILLMVCQEVFYIFNYNFANPNIDIDSQSVKQWILVNWKIKKNCGPTCQHIMGTLLLYKRLFQFERYLFCQVSWIKQIKMRYSKTPVFKHQFN